VLKGSLTVEEIQRGEVTLLRMLQDLTLPMDERIISNLRVKKGSYGLLHVETKLEYRRDTNGFKYPVLLPHMNPLVDMIIRDEHLQNMHGGVQFLLSNLREKFWIIKGRRAIRRIVNQCLRCRRL